MDLFKLLGAERQDEPADASSQADLDDDHDQAGRQLEQIRELTGDFDVPQGACTSYRNMLARLERLEHDTHMHVHRENNILFARVREQLEIGDRDASCDGHSERSGGQMGGDEQADDASAVTVVLVQQAETK